MSIKVPVNGYRRSNGEFRSFEDEVRAYEAEDNEKGQIVFYGPSNFTRWKKETYGNTPLREALPGKSGKLCCINRGFGSSCAEHQLYYYDRMVRPLAPSVLVYAPGLGNSSRYGYTAAETWELAQRVIHYAKTDFPELKIYILGLPSRYNSEAAKEFNNWMRGFCQFFPDCRFIDLAKHKDLADPAIYCEDNVHFNNEGYIRYAEMFKQELADELAKF